MSEWLKTSLIDIVELIGGGTPKTSKAEYWGGNINWLSVKDGLQSPLRSRHGS